uniref:Endonuclease/exonuclease/phosphatase domain-containing protein n=1 Tax=Biomphalaria glabrata TaxID=6526 RepID=A0A2C9L1K0_BIOGL
MIYGLGFMIKEDLYQYIEIEDDQTDRVCFLKLRTNAGIVHIINVYFPQNITQIEKKEESFLTLEDKLSKISEDEIVFILGDFNSHIGSDNLAWFRCIGEHGIPCEVNDNGQRLLEFCAFHDFGITHSFFDQTGNAQYTFQSTSKHKTYIDFCITRNKHRQFVKMTKSNDLLDASTDHLLVTSVIQISLKQHNAFQDKLLSRSEFLLVSTFVTLSLQRQRTLPDQIDAIENKWTQIKDTLFQFKSLDKNFNENFFEFRGHLNKISSIFNSVLVNNKCTPFCKITKEEVNEFGFVINEIVKKYALVNLIENIKIPEKTMLDLLNSAVNERKALNSNEYDFLFQDLPTIEEVEKIFREYKEFLDVEDFLKPNFLILQQLYALCWRSEYCPMEFSFACIAYHTLETTVVYNNINDITVIYLIGKCFADIILIRIKTLRNKTFIEQC